MRPTAAPSEIADDVRAFYRDMPFNYHATAADAARVLGSNPVKAYPDLDLLLEEDAVATVLELGCGAGWAANAMALHYGKRVVAVDFTEPALARAAEVAAIVGTTDRVRFVCSDLFSFDTVARFDLVVSIGALHHTKDCRAAFVHAASFVRPGGHVFVGLYHLHGRRPFLDLFHDILATSGEAAALAKFRAMVPEQTDETHVLSWFRDQVLHPHETQHSLCEVLDWLDACDLRLVSTSVNGYDPAIDRKALAAAEQGLEAVSKQRNLAEGRYFPGFFTLLAERPADAPYPGHRRHGDDLP